MAERLLTLAEIDAVLALHRGGGAAEAPVASYDLDTPSRAPRAALDGVVVRHELAARALRDELAALMNVEVDAVLESFDQMRFGALRDELPDPSCTFLVDLAPLREPAVIAFDYAFAFAGVDRLLGGKGDASGAPRDLTPTELTVLDDLVRPVVAAHVAAWSAYAPLRAGAARPVSSPRFVRELKAEDVLFVARYRLKGFADGAVLRFATPVNGLEPHLQKDPRPLAGQKDASYEREIASHLSQVRVALDVGVGEARLTLRELVGLEPGDVVVLDRAIHEGCALRVAGAPKFTGWLGQSRGRLTFRVQGPVKSKPASAKELAGAKSERKA